jgi:dephospho-CoA kinase
MKRVLVTGMSGTGKSTLIAELAARGYKALDADLDDWSEWQPAADGSGVVGEMDLVWREDRIHSLLSSEDAELLFFCGCASNQVKFYARFDHIILLSAPAPLIVERLATRTTNIYGKRPDEVARTLALKHTIEPRLRSVADLEVDTSAPLDQVLATVLRHVSQVRPLTS